MDTKRKARIQRNQKEFISIKEELEEGAKWLRGFVSETDHNLTGIPEVRKNCFTSDTV